MLLLLFCNLIFICTVDALLKLSLQQGKLALDFVNERKRKLPYFRNDNFVGGRSHHATTPVDCVCVWVPIDTQLRVVSVNDPRISKICVMFWLHHRLTALHDYVKLLQFSHVILVTVSIVNGKPRSSEAHKCLGEMLQNTWWAIFVNSRIEEYS